LSTSINKRLVAYRVLFGEYGSGKTQLLMEKVRQTAWDMHHAKVTIILRCCGYSIISIYYIILLILKFEVIFSE
jgi:hypothetical protein